MSTATQIDTSSDPEPIRLFESDFLEFFTHIHPAVVVIIWVPVTVYFLVSAVRSSLGIGEVIPGFLLGVFLWTLTEYTVVADLDNAWPRQDQIDHHCPEYPRIACVRIDVVVMGVA